MTAVARTVVATEPVTPAHEVCDVIAWTVAQIVEITDRTVTPLGVDRRGIVVYSADDFSRLADAASRGVLPIVRRSA